MDVKRSIIELKEEHLDFFLNTVFSDLSLDLIEDFKCLKPRLDGMVSLDIDEYNLDLLIGALTFEANYHEDKDIRKKAHQIKLILKGYREQLKI